MTSQRQMWDYVQTLIIVSLPCVLYHPLWYTARGKQLQNLVFYIHKTVTVVEQFEECVILSNFRFSKANETTFIIVINTFVKYVSTFHLIWFLTKPFLCWIIENVCGMFGNKHDYFLYVSLFVDIYSIHYLLVLALTVTRYGCFKH